VLVPEPAQQKHTLVQSRSIVITLPQISNRNHDPDVQPSASASTVTEASLYRYVHAFNEAASSSDTTATVLGRGIPIFYVTPGNK